MNEGRRHPAYSQLGDRYRAARAARAATAEIQRAASTLRMSEREYCDRFVGMSFGPVTWVGVGTDAVPFSAACDAAFEDAKP